MSVRISVGPRRVPRQEGLDPATLRYVAEILSARAADWRDVEDYRRSERNHERATNAAISKRQFARVAKNLRSRALRLERKAARVAKTKAAQVTCARIVDHVAVEQYRHTRGAKCPICRPNAPRVPS